MYVYIYTHVSVCIYVCICVRTFIYIYTCIIHVCVHVYIYIYIHLYVYIYMYNIQYTPMYTHIICICKATLVLLRATQSPESSARHTTWPRLERWISGASEKFCKSPGFPLKGSLEGDIYIYRYRYGYGYGIKYSCFCKLGVL